MADTSYRIKTYNFTERKSSKDFSLLEEDSGSRRRLRNRCSERFCKIDRKAPVTDSVFN